MKTTMDTTHIPTLKQMADFVSGNHDVVRLRCQHKTEAYAFIARVLTEHQYLSLTKPAKGVIRLYLETVVGYDRSHIARLIKQYRASGRIAPARRTQPTFKGVYTATDIAELARIDDLLDGLSGPATCRVLKREFTVFGNAAYERLQHLSVAQLYRFRQSGVYRRVRTHYTKTKPASVSIGERTKPRNDGRPGFLRVDSVHQGDKDGEKGVYHINLVDEVTQWEVVVCVAGISEQFMIPALTAAMDLFPFRLLNFHADNGSEYMNHKVADLLQRMLVKLTKSRPYHSGDNGLAETKNGAIIRKALGWVHIPRTPDNVAAINRWCAAWFVPYLNFHRACAFRTTAVDEKGKRTHRYPPDGYMMPYEKLKSLPHAEQYLKPDLTFELLDLQAYAMSDTQWAAVMQEQKAAMWGSLQL
jgi:transposase InsO family protein